MKTITIHEAAELLKVNRETLKARIRSGDVRAVKFGRGWVFIEEDLLEDIRRLYGKKKVYDKETGKTTWQSTYQQDINTGELDLPHQTDDAYSALLAPAIKGKRKNSMTSSRHNIGGKTN